MKTFNMLLGIVTLVIVSVICAHVYSNQTNNLGSVTFGNEYNSFSKVPATGSQVIKVNSGTLGSIIVTGAGGSLTIYNATTTNANLRAIAATSSLPILADLPASAAAGTYTFDIIATQGLLLDVGGSTGTSTITYR